MGGTPTLQRSRPQYRVRLPPEVHDVIGASAKAAGRSISEEIEHRLVSQHEMQGALAALSAQLSRDVISLVRSELLAAGVAPSRSRKRGA